jgi:PTH1 family peptidyl-tRNA hydrolase
MPSAKRLIIGLGNPGAEYEGTRHNVGFAVADALAEKIGVAFQHEKGNALVAWGRWRGCPFGLVKPLTYMNRSGGAARTLLGRCGLRPEEMLVVMDDLSLPPGTVRLRAQGSAGGHNGLQDIIDRLGTDQFPRLRVGIGSDFPRGRQVDYVLTPFTAQEQPLVDEAVGVACEAALTFVADGIVTAMNRFNRR